MSRQCAIIFATCPQDPFVVRSSPVESEIRASVSCSVMRRKIHHPPIIFKSTIYIVACGLDSPSRGIRRNMWWGVDIEPLRRAAKLRRISWVNLGHTTLDARLQAINQITLTSLPSTPHIHHQVFQFSTSQLLDEQIPDEKDGRTSPLPTPRSLAGRQHTSMECRWTSR